MKGLIITNEKTINMSFRINKKIKEEADKIFKELGMNTSVALNLFMAQVIREKCIPFKITLDIKDKKDKTLKD